MDEKEIEKDEKKLESIKLLLIFGFSSLLRYCVTFHPYSGENIPPMYGDYEAQRHWQEITVNLPISKWYVNSTDNDLQYWGLDYPPLTAYHSLALGVIAQYINTHFVQLHDSRGFESEDHKLFMRLTVWLADLFIYIPAIFLFFNADFADEYCEKSVSAKKSTEKTTRTQQKPVHLKKLFEKTSDFYKKTTNPRKLIEKRTTVPEKLAISDHSTEKTTIPYDSNIFGFKQFHINLITALIYPGIILIDHGHFQYNCISLGFFVLSVSYIIRKKLVLGSFFFVLALNYKQMALYHALPIFFYILAHIKCVFYRQKSILLALKIFLTVAFSVFLTFLVIWIPFLNDFSFIDVFVRLFPISRGVFEDKVSNVWCSINVFIKLRNIFNNLQLAKICLTTTMVVVLPSCLDLFLKPTKDKFLLSLINVSLGFYLFSFQVHEKSILLPAIPVVIYLHKKPLPCFWFLLVSVFSMVPLLIKDKLFLPYLALMNFYFIFTIHYATKYFSDDLHMNKKCSPLPINNKKTSLGIKKSKKVKNSENTNKTTSFIENHYYLLVFLKQWCFYGSLTGMIVLSLIMQISKPPERYPDLYSLLISVYSCGHFVLFFIYFNIKQILFNNKSVKPKTAHVKYE